MRRESINVSGETNLDELLTLIKHSELLISPDSGPIHIATCVDKPVVGLYGVTNTVRAGPYKTKELCVDKYNDALLKFENKKPEEVKWRFKNNHKDVMSLISTEDVIEKINNYFTSRRVS
jgi:heptosyltransferase I